MELTLIVAATRSMGIGAKGGLPWTGLRKEMAYFARVTKRLPSQSPPDAVNAVIMGRKTWDSIPPKFRPLKGRLNLVISRSVDAPPQSPVDVDAEPVRVASLEDAVRYLQDGALGGPLGKVFVIGGAQIYASSLALPAARRVLLTKVLEPEFEACDTHFPLALDGPEGHEAGEGWRRREKAALDEWTGEEVAGGVQEENGTKYEFQLWEKQT
ncbi:dihydrofolate reductase [Plectosphaerella cucumerina]|uniref:Dihydrofolate reductase n=1 Tax=Plectosphaerella cucumerina TaxID=40658 RepID=A0A8K0T5I8_9PEZI|nr:dihydrofolate reductase [Plectosphaerella cucumerina]